MWSFLSTQHWWGHTWNSESISGFLYCVVYRREMEVLERVQQKGKKETIKELKHLSWGKAKKVGTVLGRSCLLKGEYRFFSEVPQEAMATKLSTGVPSAYCKKKSLFCKWLSNGTSYPESYWKLPPYRKSEGMWTWSCETCCRCPCLSREIRPNDLQRYLPTSAILWCSDSMNWKGWLPVKTASSQCFKAFHT